MNDNVYSKYFNYYTILYSFLIPLGVALQNIGIAIFFILWILDLCSKGKIKKTYTFFVFTLYSFAAIFSVIYSEDKISGFDKIYGMLPLFVFPLFFFIKKNVFLNKKTIVYAICSFSVSLLLVVSTNLLYLLIYYNFDLLVIKELSGKFFAQGLVNYHYLYLAYYISISIILIIYLNTFFKLKIKYFRTISISAAVFLFSYLFFLGSRISLIIVFFIGSFIFFKWVFNTKKIKTGLIFMMFLSIASFSAFYLKLPLVEKVKEAINYNGEYSSLKKVWGGKMMREEIWSCSINLIKEKPLLGYGVGSVQKEINNCLEHTSENPVLYLGRFTFNAHNQYLQIALTSGIVALMSFIFFLIYTTIVSFIRKNYFYVIFIIVSCLTFLTESMLERNHGIIIFAFFCVLFYSHNDNLENEEQSVLIS